MTLSALHKPTENDDTLSVLIDGELADAQAISALRRLSESDAQRARFAAYCAIGDALRGMPESNPDFTGRVMAALASEPTVLAPLRKPLNRRPTLWLAAATVTAISWALWQSDPRQDRVAPIAAHPAPHSADTMAYLAAHQDFSQALMSTPEMQFTRVTLAGDVR